MAACKMGALCIAANPPKQDTDLRFADPLHGLPPGVASCWVPLVPAKADEFHVFTPEIYMFHVVD